MVFSKSCIDGNWMWGEHSIPQVSNYTYLGIVYIGWRLGCTSTCKRE